MKPGMKASFVVSRVCAVLEPPFLDAHTILEVMNTGAFPQGAGASTRE